MQQYSHDNKIDRIAFENFLLGFLNIENRLDFSNSTGPEFFQAMSKIAIQTHKDIYKITKDTKIISSSRSGHENLFSHGNTEIDNQRPVVHVYDQVNAMINFNIQFVVKLLKVMEQFKQNNCFAQEMDQSARIDMVNGIKQDLTLAMAHAYQVYQQHLNGEVVLTDLTQLYADQKPFDVLIDRYKHTLYHRNTRELLMNFHNDKAVLLAYHDICVNLHNWAIEELYYAP